MKLPRWMSLFDIGAIVIVVLLPIMPGRAYLAESAALAAFRGKTTPAEVRWRLVMAQARNIQAPGTANAVTFVGALTSASFGDWAVDEAHRAASASRAGGADDAGWRQAFLVSEAYADRLEPVLALKWAKLAERRCRENAGSGEPCPADWNPRLAEYIKAFEAGVASGIDPRRNPNGFRAAAESALRMIRPGAQ